MLNTFFVSWVRKQGKLRAIVGVVEEKAKWIIVLGWCWKSVLIMKVKTDCKEGIQVVPQRNLYFTIPWNQSPFPWSLLTCHGIWVSYNDEACIEAREWLPPALRTQPRLTDKHGEKWLKDTGIKKLSKVQQQHPWNHTWILFIHLLIRWVAIKT